MRRIVLFAFSVTSLNSVSQTDLLNTDFQSGIPASYSLVDNDGLTPNVAVSNFTSAWIVIEDPENSGDQVAASTSYFEPVGTANRWMITPAINLGTFGNFVEWSARSQDASFPDDYLVLVSNTDNQLSSFTDTIGRVIEENFEWTYRTVDLSDEGYDNQTIYIAFVNNTENGYKLYVDDIRVWKDDQTGFIEKDQLEANVYPNPFHGEINVSSEEESVINVFSSDGMMILSTSEKKINMSKFPNGIYYVNIRSAGGVKTVKAIKF